MTTNEIINYYANLLIVQYANKPKAYATIQTLVGPVIMDQLPTQVQDAYGVDTAVGVQLDILGKYVGVTRTASGLGLSVTLNDTDFRTLIKFAIALNNNGSSMADIVDALDSFFPNSIYVFDHLTMRMTFILDSDLGSVDLINSILIQNLLPKPMGVRKTVIYNPVIVFFGMRTYYAATTNISPFNSYANSPQPTYTWLNYSMAI
jgi:hypothetical protein